MSRIRHILQHLKNGKTSNRKMAKLLGIDKETVNNYVRKIKADSKDVDELLGLEDPIQSHEYNHF